MYYLVMSHNKMKMSSRCLSDRPHSGYGATTNGQDNALRNFHDRHIYLAWKQEEHEQHGVLFASVLQYFYDMAPLPEGTRTRLWPWPHPLPWLGTRHSCRQKLALRSVRALGSLSLELLFGACSSSKCCWRTANSA